MAGVFDIVLVRDLYFELISLLGEIEPMERLNDLLRSRFQFSPAIFGFVQGMNNDLLYALTFRDRETSRQVFQLPPDEQPAVSEEGQS